MAYKTKVSWARFQVTDYRPDEMIHIGERLREVIFRRLDQGLTINDTPAKPLSDGKIYVNAKGETKHKRGYKTYKQRKTGSALRDLKYTGETRRAIKVLRAMPNQAVVGAMAGTKQAGRGGKKSFTYGAVIGVNNARSAQWGVSPMDRAALQRIVKTLPSRVTVKAR